MSTGPRRVLGYVRRSTDKQAISPEVQEEQLTVAADLLGWGALDLRREEAASAKSLDDRPVLAVALDDLRAGRADALAVAKLDRLSRSVQDFAGLLNTAKDEGWSVICLDLGIDTSTMNGRLVAHIRASTAEWERELIGQRTREGMARIRATTGKHMGRPSLMPAEVEDRIVRLHRNGASASAIARRFNEEGVSKGPGARSRVWNHAHVAAAVRRAEVRAAAEV